MNNVPILFDLNACLEPRYNLSYNVYPFFICFVIGPFSLTKGIKKLS